MKYSPWLSLFPVATLGCLIPLTVKAQVTTDGTTSTTVNQDGNNFIIEQGDRINDNLFHSFNEFSVLTGGSAAFNNAGDIANIFSRVTGNNISNIDGLISANGAANLYLINPNGIIFGQNARLDLGGSFFASTADSLLFEGDAEFSAVDPQAPPLLEVSIPIGARFRDNPGDIVNQSRFGFDGVPIGLFIQPEENITFLGGEIRFNGGIVSAPASRVQLGGISEAGIVGLKEDGSLSLSDDLNRDDITFINEALVDTTDDRGGEVDLRGRRIFLTGESNVFSLTLGSQSGGNITIDATESVELIGSGFPSNTGLFNAAFAGISGDIEITTKNLTVQNGARISALAINEGQGGNITINAQKIEIDGVSEDSQAGSSIATQTGGFLIENIDPEEILAFAGKAGDISIDTEDLILNNGARIRTSTFNAGLAGNLNIQASKTFELIGSGFSQNDLIASGLFADTEDDSSGNAGQITIEARNLIVKDGAQIGAGNRGNGQGGTLKITAFDSIELVGTLDENNPGGLFTSSTNNGTAGDLTLQTDNLTIADGASVSVSSPSGLAGNLNITANSLFQNQGQLTAETGISEGDIGANINLEISDIWRIENGSQVSATAFGDANGGNININQNTPDTEFLLFAFPPTDSDGSDITANAEQGDGGRIDITAAGVFGIEFRDISPEEAQSNSLNDFSVSSQFGTSGETIINRTVEDPTSGLINLPASVGDASDQISQNPCEQGVGSEFTITGKGGLPPNINESLNSESAQVGLIETVPSPQQKVEANNISLDNSISEATPAMGWVFNDKGEVTLTAYSNTDTAIKRSEQQHRSTCKSGISP